MRIVCLGGGPAGLYFAALMKKAEPRHEIVVIERNGPDETFGFGVVFSDETLSYLGDADAESQRLITAKFSHWDAIEIRRRGEVVTSTGHGFSGLSRRALLSILQDRCRELGVELRFSTDVPDPLVHRDADLLVAADGVNSRTRQALASAFSPTVEQGEARYVWLGTKHRFPAFTFAFEETDAGLFQAHAYRFDESSSTFIVECSEETFQRAGLEGRPIEETLARMEKLFAAHLGGEPLVSNRSSWIRFPTLRCERWHDANVVLVGDAAHTAHFSIGSGTKMAMEDAIALAGAFRGKLDPTRDEITAALRAYEEERRPIVERTQRVAQHSRRWFERSSRYLSLPIVPFSLSLLTRSKQIGYENLRLRDPALIEGARERFASLASAAAEVPASTEAPPPMFTPFKLRGVTLKNRVVVSPMCMYSARDGLPDDFHLVHLGSRALGGAGLVYTEMTNVAPDARITPGCTGIWSEAHARAWGRIVDFVHERSTAKIALQLGHAGRKGSTHEPWKFGENVPLAEGGWPLYAPSAIAYDRRMPVPREMDRADMDRVIAEFSRATELGRLAGFDWLEVHMAHGYLLATFLSPLTNRRTDAYGGSLQNRLRFPLEVFAAVRRAWPSDRPLGARLSATDWTPGGQTGDDTVIVARALRDAGADIVDLSSGQTVPEQRPEYGRMFQAQFADQVRQEVAIPTMTVGNVTSADQVNTILTSMRADLVMLARPHLRDPYWTLHAADEQGYRGVGWPEPYHAVDPGFSRANRKLSEMSAKKLPMPEPAGLAPRLVPFFRANARDLPWRRDRTGYRVWVSEVMLQQTRVATVIPYFARFLARFPTVRALAEAPIADVLAQWSGLGYYRRARGLHAGAQEIVARFGGEVPGTTAELESIRGIGPYTAGAIASLAFGERAALVDGNVVRVFARVFGLTDDMRKPAAQKRVWQLAREALPGSNAGEHNEALMELGATVCTPKSPACDRCPLADVCVAKREGKQAELPVLGKKKAPTQVHAAALVVRENGSILLARRRGDALFGGLWEPPMVEAATPEAAADELRTFAPKAKAGATVTHVLSHRTMTIVVHEGTREPAKYPAIYDEAKRVAEADLAGYGVSTLARKVLAAAKARG